MFRRYLVARILRLAIASLPAVVLLLSAAPGGCPGPCGYDPSENSSPPAITFPG